MREDRNASKILTVEFTVNRPIGRSKNDGTIMVSYRIFSV